METIEILSDIQDNLTAGEPLTLVDLVSLFGEEVVETLVADMQEV